MKITKTFLAIGICGMLLTGCKESGKEPDNASNDNKTAEAPAKGAKIETATFQIEGMTCAQGCAKSLESDLSGLDGVVKATVDYDKKTATVEFDASKQSPEKLVQIVEDAGDGRTYKVSNMKSSGDHAMLIDPEKAKKKAAKKGDKKEGCTMATKDGKKPACCSAKKPCHGDEKAGTM